MRYIIKVWETAEERKQGLSEIIEADLTDIHEAIDRAKAINNRENYNVIEVQNSKQNTTYYSNTPESEETYENEIKNAERQELINKYAKLAFNSELKEKDEEVFGKAKDIIKYLKDGVKYATDPINEMDEYYIEMIKKESKELIKEINKNFEADDYIHIFIHPMSEYFVLATDTNELLDIMLEEYEEIIEETDMEME